MQTAAARHQVVHLLAGLQHDSGMPAALRPRHSSQPSGPPPPVAVCGPCPRAWELPASPASLHNLAASPAHSGRSLSRAAFESWAAEELDAGGDGGGIGGLDFSLDAMGLGEAEDAVWRRTRGRMSLADVSLEELEAQLQRGDEDRAAAEDAEYHQFLEARLLSYSRMLGW